MKNFVASIAILALAGLARAGSIDVKVGYADGLRANGFFPSPWSGDAGVVFDGRTSGTFDDGAVRIDNTGASNVTISNIFVDSFENGASFALWGTHTLLPGQKLILTATSGDNFDTSDQPIHPGPDRGGYASSAKPVVHFTVDGTQNLSFTDSGQILNTGGFDFAANQFGGFDRNESFGWRDIGTTGITDPGGDQTPEPASLTLLGIGIAGMLAYRWRKQKPAVA
jgi:hypothetical protein